MNPQGPTCDTKPSAIPKKSADADGNMKLKSAMALLIGNGNLAFVSGGQVRSRHLTVLNYKWNIVSVCYSVSYPVMFYAMCL